MIALLLAAVLLVAGYGGWIVCNPAATLFRRVELAGASVQATFFVETAPMDKPVPGNTTLWTAMLDQEQRLALESCLRETAVYRYGFWQDADSIRYGREDLLLCVRDSEQGVGLDLWLDPASKRIGISRYTWRDGSFHPDGTPEAHYYVPQAQRLFDAVERLAPA